MKRLLMLTAAVLALVMVLSLATVAFADDKGPWIVDDLAHLIGFFTGKTVEEAGAAQRDAEARIQELRGRISFGTDLVSGILEGATRIVNGVVEYIGDSVETDLWFTENPVYRAVRDQINNAIFRMDLGHSIVENVVQAAQDVVQTALSYFGDGKWDWERMFFLVKS